MSSWKILNTSVRLAPDSSDDTWTTGLEYAILERFALNNATRITDMCTKEQYLKFPLGPHGENYFGCSRELLNLPDAQEYFERLVEACERHFAWTRYGYENIDPGANVSQLMRRQPSAYRDVHNLAVAMVDSAVEFCRDIWRRRCENVYNEYGDVYAKVFGPDAPEWGL